MDPFETYSDISEAEEVGFVDEADAGDEEVDGEDLMDTFEDDYEEDDDNDQYEEEIIDDEVYDLDPEAVARAERELSRRDAGRVGYERHSRYYALQSILQQQERAHEEEEEEEAPVLRRRTRLFAASVRVPPGGDNRVAATKEELPYPDPNVSVTDRAREILREAFSAFLWFHKREEDGFADQTYVDAVESLAEKEQTSLFVAWTDLSSFCLKLSDWLTYHPVECFSIFDDVLGGLVREHFPDLAAFKDKTFAVRIRKYTFYEPLSSLRVDISNQLVAVECVCVRRSAPQPKLRKVYFICTKCGHDSNGPYEKKYNEKDVVKKRCLNCQASGPFFVNKLKSLFEPHQKLVVQELPAHIKAGQVPRQREVVVVGDLVDFVRPGEEIIVVGAYCTKADTALNAASGFPVFSTYLLANNVEKCNEKQISEITEKEMTIIQALSRRPGIRDKIIKSIAPSIWGHRHVKTALAMALFGGVRQDVGGRGERLEGAKHMIRGDVNVLLVGDPGLAKSQLLKYCQNTFDRTILTSGKGASASGLTAAMKKDPVSGEWSLEGGALVLADRGICLIDEFDKMTDKDRVSIHEAMAQQTISISKAGICTTLRARCSVVAAANPKFGRYDPQLTFLENVDLGDTLLSRFDVVAVMRDNPSPLHDEYLAQYILGTHFTSHPDAAPDERLANEAPDLDDPTWLDGNDAIPHEILKKYIVYARQTCFPRVSNLDKDKVVDFYSQLRQAALRSGGLPLTVRHLESILRMACANAKMRLSSSVSSADFDYAISTMLESFIQSQKHAVANNLCKKFGRYRSLACSSPELLDGLLNDMLKRKAHMAMLRSGLRSEDMVTTYVNHFQEVAVPLSELTTLAGALYGLPASSVQRFAEQKRFRVTVVNGETLIGPAASSRDADRPQRVLSPDSVFTPTSPLLHAT